MELTTLLRSYPKERDSLRSNRTYSCPSDERDYHPPWCSIPGDFHEVEYWLTAKATCHSCEAMIGH